MKIEPKDIGTLPAWGYNPYVCWRIPVGISRQIQVSKVGSSGMMIIR